MYSWLSHTWNPIRGRCPHNCSYCYMRRFKVGKLRLEEKELNEDLGEANVIFVGSSTDVFADAIPSTWIMKVLRHCNKCPDNTYLFQSKNPKRLLVYETLKLFPPKTILGTTIETNRNYDVSLAPKVSDRQRFIRESSCKKMVSIEPIIDFDLDIFVDWLKDINPSFVSVGADSKGHNLPEPRRDKTEELIEELESFTKVYVKKNLKRITPMRSEVFEKV